jgi:hypothetical protein
MTVPLSPAAQAIVAAFDERYELLGPLEGNWQEVCIADALRAAADQVVPDEPDYMRAAVPSTDWWDKHDSIRSELLAIATELESH